MKTIEQLIQERDALAMSINKQIIGFINSNPYIDLNIDIGFVKGQLPNGSDFIIRANVDIVLTIA